jgi:uncharacterized protein (DUF488 family)
MTQLFTIGFTKKSARDFFEILRRTHAKTLLDVRLHNASQLSGFSKRDDLEYFLAQIPHMAYDHRLDLAPTQEMLSTYRKVDRDWERYERRFLRLMSERRIEQMPRKTFSDAVLLCSEANPEFCHRRLIAEYLQGHWPDLEVTHL